MCSEPVIRATGLGKRYRIRLGPPPTLRETIAGLGKRLTGRAQCERWEEHWALRNLDLDIHRGERVALLGANGSGKSTVLKILCRITRPTTGELRIHGRVASMLEVGTGFHPELSGRENIWLNAAILGLDRAATQDRFAAFVGFSEIGRFLDTPVKHYSSGMYVRLAFAIAAHVDADILAIDEVLAVGDVHFRAKCLDLLVGDSRRTVILVSHDLEAVRRVASRGVVMAHGAVVFDGPVEEAIARYADRAAPSADASNAS